MGLYGDSSAYMGAMGFCQAECITVKRYCNDNRSISFDIFVLERILGMVFYCGVVWYIQVLPSSQCSFFTDSDISDPLPSVGYVWSDIIPVRAVAEYRGKLQQVPHLHPHYVLLIVRTLRQCTSSNIICSS
jgi:hypothetical protein